MRVDTIDLFSNDSKVVSFDVGMLDVRNPYIIKGITGLDADAIVPRFYGQGAVSNVRYYDMALEPREIAIRIGLNPNYNLNLRPSDLRGDLYRAIASSRSGQIQLRFNDDSAVVGAISGFVTKFEAPLFAKETEVQITMRCDDPVFKSLYTTNVVVDSLSTSALVLTDPVSTSPHGFKMELTFTDSVTDFIIQEKSLPDAPNWLFKINYSFIVFDYLVFSSVDNDKYLYVERAGDITYLMDSLEIGSIWPILFPGDNEFEVYADDNFVYNAIYYNETHWGV